MAQQLRLTDTDITNLTNSYIEELKKQFKNKKVFSKKMSVDFSMPAKEDKATIHFTPMAWIKMTELISVYSTEVQWHFLTARLDEHTFIIYDIIVPPHEVSGTTVVSDDEEYAKWLCELPDVIFDNLKGHGHSHVNMAVNPSGVDMDYRHSVVNQLPIPTNQDEDSFYIFLIFNKSHSWSGEIYDISNNTLYDTADITLNPLLDSTGELDDLPIGEMSMFLDEAKTLAKAKSCTTYTKKSEPVIPCTKKDTPKKDTKPKERTFYDDFKRNRFGWDEYEELAELYDMYNR